MSMLSSMFLALAIGAAAGESRCASYSPNCGFSVEEAQSTFLTSYADLYSSLEDIANDAVPGKDIHVGPLIQNNGNGGIINIDGSIDASLCSMGVDCNVCGTDQASTIRDAVVCTVTNDPIPRGNTDPQKIGFSTNKRELLGARIGNSASGKRVFIISQLHGNEAASTEAALEVLRVLATRENGWVARVLDELDILFLIRANPDSGEPFGINFPALDPDHPANIWSDFGFLPVDLLSYISPQQYTFESFFPGRDGFFRQNLDINAGGGFQGRSEDDFFGVVGRGYDLNRYNHAELDKAIRPVESQAVIAAMLAFKPDIVFDMHGDVPKSICSLDESTLETNAVLDLLPTMECMGPDPPVPTLETSRESMVVASIIASNKDDSSSDVLWLAQKIATDMGNVAHEQVEGQIARFSQLSLGIAQLRGTTLDAARSLGAAANGVEVLNFGLEARPAVFRNTGDPTMDISFDTHMIDPCFLPDNICIHELLLEEFLKASAKYVTSLDSLNGSPEFCNLPVESNNVGIFPSELGWAALGLGADEVFQVPFGDVIGFPTAKSGMCPCCSD